MNRETEIPLSLSTVNISHKRATRVLLSIEMSIAYLTSVFLCRRKNSSILCGRNENTSRKCHRKSEHRVGLGSSACTVVGGSTVISN